MKPYQPISKSDKLENLRINLNRNFNDAREVNKDIIN